MIYIERIIDYIVPLIQRFPRMASGIWITDVPHVLLFEMVISRLIYEKITVIGVMEVASRGCYEAL